MNPKLTKQYNKMMCGNNTYIKVKHIQDDHRDKLRLFLQ